jgi:hypothetical protein
MDRSQFYKFLFRLRCQDLFAIMPQIFAVELFHISSPPLPQVSSGIFQTPLRTIHLPATRNVCLSALPSGLSY